MVAPRSGRQTVAFDLNPSRVSPRLCIRSDLRVAQAPDVSLETRWRNCVQDDALGGAQTPEDVAALVSFLAGPDSYSRIEWGRVRNKLQRKCLASRSTRSRRMVE